MHRQKDIRKKRPVGPIDDLRSVAQTGSFLVTDMNKYLDKTRGAPHTNCISCDKCLAIKGKFLQFKYPQQLGSHYMQQMKDPSRKSLSPKKVTVNEEENKAVVVGSSSPQKRMQANNRSSLIEQLKIPFEKPLFTKTMYANAFMNHKGSDQVGATDAMGRNPAGFRHVAPIGDLEMFKNMSPKFTGQTSSKIDFAGYGGKRLPTPNRRTYQSITTGNGKFYGKSAYGEMFVNATTQGSRELYCLERMRSKERKEEHVRGSISPRKKLPFIGR